MGYSSSPKDESNSISEKGKKIIVSMKFSKKIIKYDQHEANESD